MRRRKEEGEKEREKGGGRAEEEEGNLSRYIHTSHMIHAFIWY